MKKKHIDPKWLPKIMWAYSHWVKIDLWNSEILFISWQTASDEKWNPISKDDIIAETEYIFKNIEKILKEWWLELENIIKVNIYLTNKGDFIYVSPIRNKYLANSKPATSVTIVKEILQKWCNIKIDIIAVKWKEMF